MPDQKPLKAIPEIAGLDAVIAMSPENFAYVVFARKSCNPLTTLDESDYSGIEDPTGRAGFEPFGRDSGRIPQFFARQA
jgi:hypothetical protein